MQHARTRVPVWLWLVLPILAVAGQLLARWSLPEVYPFLESELGPIELGTVALLLPAAWLSTRVLRQCRPLPRAWLAGWFAVVALGCFYMAGEELSWGQHVFGWGTPEWIAEHNDQDETNLHNVSGWFDQTPRLLLELWVTATLLIATARLFNGTAFDESKSAHWFWGWPAVIPAALMSILIRLPERIETWTEWTRPVPFNIRLSELQEFCFAAFLLVYVWAVLARLRSRQCAVQPGSAT